VVLANDFSACRHGLDTTILDLDGSRRPLREVAAGVLEEARRSLAPDGLAEPLDVLKVRLTDRPEHRRQRDLREQHGMPALLADLAARTVDVDG